jgi:hypothetical protein
MMKPTLHLLLGFGRLRLFLRTTALSSALVMVATASSLAQTLTVLHNFTGGQDGGTPFAGLTMDAGGNLYGAAAVGGIAPCPSHQDYGCGIVFKLTKRTNWTLSSLYAFQGGNDGAYPLGNVTIGGDGSLYGTTAIGGGGANCQLGVLSGCGTVYNLRPPARPCTSIRCSWTETVLFSFPNNLAGSFPEAGVTFDAVGNIYGTNFQGSTGYSGNVFELTPSGSGWNEIVLHAFTSIIPDGGGPQSGVIFDSAGNLYGTANYGGTTGGGMVYQLDPMGSGSPLTQLYAFSFPNIIPEGGLIMDSAGNLYGTTVLGSGAGSVFELISDAGGWTYQLLYALPGPRSADGPTASLAMDAAGNLYGTTYNGGGSSNCNLGCGTIFKLTHSNGSWTYTLLHAFTGAEGSLPYGSVALDANGNLYGTTTLGGSYNEGVVWELTQ